MVGWRRRLRCPKCGRVFDYEFVPGASFTAVRLGTSRYMRCPLCGKFSLFSMLAVDQVDEASSESAGRDAPPVARFSDVSSTAKWGLLLAVPFVVLALLAAVLLPRPEPALWVGVVGAVGFVAVALIVLVRARPKRVE
jgi:hypothetical protein